MPGALIQLLPAVHERAEEAVGARELRLAPEIAALVELGLLETCEHRLAPEIAALLDELGSTSRPGLDAEALSSNKASRFAGSSSHATAAAFARLDVSCSQTLSCSCGHSRGLHRDCVRFLQLPCRNATLGRCHHCPALPS